MKILLTTIIVFMTIVAKGQTLVTQNGDVNIKTEYDDGKMWAYRDTNDFVVGLTVYETKDDYGRYYQMVIYVRI